MEIYIKNNDKSRKSNYPSQVENHLSSHDKFEIISLSGQIIWISRPRNEKDLLGYAFVRINNESWAKSGHKNPAQPPKKIKECSDKKQLAFVSLISSFSHEIKYYKGKKSCQRCNGSDRFKIKKNSRVALMAMRESFLIFTIILYDVH